jgi:hypothetical protein
MELAVSFFRHCMRRASAAPASEAPDLTEAVQSATSRRAARVEIYAAQLQRTLEAVGHVDRNINQATLLECWLDDLQRIATGEAVGVGNTAPFA